MSKFEQVMNINVNSKTEKKGKLTYLSWAWAWAEFKKVYPEARYEVKKFNDLPYVHDPETGYMVYTSVTAEDQTYEMWLPVMDAYNKAIMKPSMFEINKTIMRCLTKNLAMFGLGLYIYAGEDLPEDEQALQEPREGAKRPASNKETEVATNAPQNEEDALKSAMGRKIVLKGMERKLEDLSTVTLQALAQKAKDKSLRDDMLRVMQAKFTEELRASGEESPI